MLRGVLRAAWNNKRRIFAVGIVVKIVGTLLFFLLVSSSINEDLNVGERGKRDAAPKADDKKYMEFNDFLNGEFRAKSFYPHWVSGEEYVYRRSDGSFAKVGIETGLAEDEILPANIWNSYPNQMSWSLSADQTFMAIQFNQTDGYAHYVRTFSIAFIDMATKAEIMSTDFPEAKIQKFKWSPVGHAFTYVLGFDVYISADPMTSPIRITNDGDERMTFNGIADWLFWVEITDDDALLWWSPDGQYLAFATIVETDVKPFEFTLYGKLQYPKTVRIPYPKAGTPVPKTHLTIVDVTHVNTTRLDPHDHIEMMWPDHYLNSAVWISNNTFVPTWKSRLQNESLSETCVAPNFTCSHFHAMMDVSTTGWVGHYKVAHIFPSNSESEYFTVRSNGGFPHLARMDAGTMAIDWRTNGSFEVTDTSLGYNSIHNYDPTFDWVYYTSTEMANNTGEGLPRIRHLWRAKAHGDDITRSCITCELNQIFADRCNWVNPSFSKGGSYLVVNCGGTGNGVPISTVHKKDSVGDYQFVRIAENNTDLQNKLEEYYFRDRVYGTIKLPGVQGDWYYTMHKPPNFDPTKKYPMMVQVYSGPGYQEVTDRFAVSWKDYVSSSLGVIVTSFDGRGTGFRGDETMHMVYKRLGEFEPLDQIAAARILAEQNSFIDPSRKAIWGWSYGGYATTKTIAADSENIYKCGYAVAPVTDWHFYHAIYTERFMLKPSDNMPNYKASSALNSMENFKSHKFTILHGTSDENVHFQNAARLSARLIASDVDHDASFAADNDHNMRNTPNNYRDVYKTITRKMKTCFNLE